MDESEIVKLLAQRCRPWLSLPGPGLQSLSYDYQLGNDQKHIELVAGGAPVRRSMWQGATLHLGLHVLAATPGRFDVTSQLIKREGTEEHSSIRLNIRPNDGNNAFRLEVGNGIAGSWRGYFSRSSAKMQLDLDPETLLPQRELHDRVEFTFGEWQQAGDGGWVPRLVLVKKDAAIYRMHFAWTGNAVWLLTKAEVSTPDGFTPIARVSNVEINDPALVAEHAAKQRRQRESRQIVRRMLAKNAHWLAPKASFDSLQYTFHIERQDVKERCAIRRNGTVAFQVAHDGKGAMAERLGDRLIALADGRIASASAADARAFVQDEESEGRGPVRADQLRRYALIGCQFDMPLFELTRLLDDATIEIVDGHWKDVPCHVATITLPPRSAYLGCGVMLGFTSWSYVHHLYPAKEIIYIDKERLAPLHETLIESREARRFEIEFANYQPVDAHRPESAAPRCIEIRSDDYFTCIYDFQLVEGRHWLLKAVESWFTSDETSRGGVQDIGVNQASQLADDAERQVQAYLDLFERGGREAMNSGAITPAVDTLPFKLGQPLKINAVELVFTLDSNGNLILRCTADNNLEDIVGQHVVALLLDEANRLLQASQGAFKRDKDGKHVALAPFGQSEALGATSRFVVAGLGDVSGTAGADTRRMRSWPIEMDAATPCDGVADQAGQTQLIDVKLRKAAANRTSAALHFASRDSMNEFELDAAIAIFDNAGRLLAATNKTGHLRVESKIVEETWDLALPPDVAMNEIGSVAVGLSRGQTVSAPMGSVWGTLLYRASPFSVDVLLSAAAPECWQEALRRLEKSNDETLERGLLGSDHRWRDQLASQDTPADLLKSKADRLLQIIEQAGDPSTLAAGLRLLGYSGDARASAPATRLLGHDDPAVQDAAAIALGLLRREEGLERLDAILSRPEPNNAARDRRINYKMRRDALIALTSIRSEASVNLVQKWMQSYVDGIETVETAHGFSRGGTAHEADQLALLLARMQDPRHARVLAEAISRVESRGDGAQNAGASEWLELIIQADALGRDFISPRIKRGDTSTLSALESSRDEHYVAAVRQVLDSDLAANAWHGIVDYLWNIGSQEAVDVLRKAFDRGSPRGEQREAVRLRIATALAAHGDYRGFPEALTVLVDIAEQGDPPTDEKMRKQWNREVERRRDRALDVFDRAGNAAVAEFVVQHAGDTTLAERDALLGIMEEAGLLPDSIRSHVERWTVDPSSKAIANRAARMLAVSR